MNKLRTMTTSGLALFSLLLLAFPSAAVASTQTVHFHNATATLPFGNPCSGAAGAFQVTFSGVAHVTNDSAGGQRATMTLHGDFMFVPTDPTQPTFTGHFTLRSGGNMHATSSGMEMGFAAIWNGIGSDGSTLKFHVVGHMTVNAGGTTTVSFFTVKCL